MAVSISLTIELVEIRPSLIPLHNQETCDLVIIDAASLEDFAQEWAFNFIKVTHEEILLGPPDPWRDSLVAKAT